MQAWPPAWSWQVTQFAQRSFTSPSPGVLDMTLTILQ
jgi:hypothetical protein